MEVLATTQFLPSDLVSHSTLAPHGITERDSADVQGPWRRATSHEVLRRLHLTPDAMLGSLLSSRVLVRVQPRTGWTTSVHSSDVCETLIGTFRDSRVTARLFKVGLLKTDVLRTVAVSIKISCCCSSIFGRMIGDSY